MPCLRCGCATQPLDPPLARTVRPPSAPQRRPTKPPVRARSRAREAHPGARSRERLRVRRAAKRSPGADAAHHPAARRHLPGASRDGIVRRVPGAGWATPKRGCATPATTAMVAQPVRGQRAARRHRSRGTTSSERHAADDDRPQPGRHAGGQGPARAERRIRASRCACSIPSSTASRSARASSIRSPAREAARRRHAVAYVSAVGAGGAAFLLPNQWRCIGKLRIRFPTRSMSSSATPSASTCWRGASRRRAANFQHNGKAQVRNVTLPATYSHVFVPLVAGARGRAPGARLDRRITCRADARDASHCPATGLDTCCGPPTSGTASRSTGASRRSAGSARVARTRRRNRSRSKRHPRSAWSGG